MRDLDARAQVLMKDIDKLADEYLRNIKKETSEKKKKQLQYIQSLFNKAKEYGDDKVQLAIQTYELVDKHIRRLDSDLARFETEMQDKAFNKAQEESGTTKKGRRKLKEKEKRKKSAASSEDETKSARKKQKKGGAVASTSSASAAGSGAQVESNTLGHTADVLDMPVDPNEPTYCLCHQVSYGEMIGCDNPDVRKFYSFDVCLSIIIIF